MPNNHRFWGFPSGKQLILRVTIRIDPTLIVVLEGHPAIHMPPGTVGADAVDGALKVVARRVVAHNVDERPLVGGRGVAAQVEEVPARGFRPLTYAKAGPSFSVMSAFSEKRTRSCPRRAARGRRCPMRPPTRSRSSSSTRCTARAARPSAACAAAAAAAAAPTRTRPCRCWCTACRRTRRCPARRR